MIANFSNNSDNLMRLLEDFYNLTSMKICIWDPFGKELCYFPERFSPFCEALRRDPSLDEKCRECDISAMEKCRKSGKAVIYTCHAGLFEGVAPIVVNGNILGFIAIGQIKGDDSKPPEHILKISDLTNKYSSLPKIPQDKIYSALRIVEACAGYETLKEYLKGSSTGLNILLEEFIDSNLDENIDVSSLTKALKLSRSEIYELCKHYYSTTPADLIKKRRLEKAARLLETTNMKVSDIASSCGIPDYNYFSKVFKKHFKISPREYRNDHK